jgi:hypothetical protein
MEVARRWPDILSLGLHPGLVRTDIGRDTALRFVFRYAPFLISPDQAARRLVRLATAPASELTNGTLYGDRQAHPAESAPLQRGQRGAALDNIGAVDPGQPRLTGRKIVTTNAATARGRQRRPRAASSPTSSRWPSLGQPRSWDHRRHSVAGSVMACIGGS